MATYTSNLNLKKPALDDDALITDINNNMDILDAAANGIEDALAIVANGNTHAAITSGQFVYVRNHSTLTEGLYVASSNIAANATLSSSNLAADSKGGLNALSEQIGTLNGKLPISYSKGAVAAKEFVGIYGFVTTSGTYLALYLPIILNPDITDITNISITNAGLRIADGGYVIGNGADLTQYVSAGYVNKLQGLIRFDLNKSDGWGFTNNTICIGNATLAFTLS